MRDGTIGRIAPERYRWITDHEIDHDNRGYSVSGHGSLGCRSTRENDAFYSSHRPTKGKRRPRGFLQAKGAEAISTPRPMSHFLLSLSHNLTILHTRSCPSTESPSFTFSSAILPECGALMTISCRLCQQDILHSANRERGREGGWRKGKRHTIFIALNTATGSPFFTSPPSCTRTSTTTPDMGAPT